MTVFGRSGLSARKRVPAAAVASRAPASPSDADEGRPEEYRNRRGYAPGFLLDRKGGPVPVAPPVVRDSGRARVQAR